jgi:peptidoglycan hydrolase-like protein with peptidoglycan-binding domain
MARAEERTARSDGALDPVGTRPDGNRAAHPGPPSRTRRRRRFLAAVVAVTVAGGAAGAWAVIRARSDGRAPSRAGRSRTATATVARRTLLSRQTESGTLGYADSRTTGAASGGTVTWLPKEGSVLRRGDPLYAVNGRSTVLMNGRFPAWRTLQVGVTDGPDVRELERNLAALGDDPDGDIEVDGHFDWATRAAVERWQDDRGLDETGVVELGDVTFLPGARRVGTLDTSVGATIAPGAAVFDTSSTERVVTVDLDASDQDLVHVGDRVRIDLPDGTTTPGRVSDVGRVASSGTDENGNPTTPTVTVTIRVRRPRETGSLDQAPVDVEFVDEARRRVLAVPVSALVALAGDRFAVEVVDGSRHRMVDVTPGLFADGYVEVAGIAEGMHVVVPR